MSCETRPICLAILSMLTTDSRGSKKTPLDADGCRGLQVAVADRSPITKGQGSRPPRRCRGGGLAGGREIAYQAWEEGRSADPGVLLAASLTESGCTER